MVGIPITPLRLQAEVRNWFKKAMPNISARRFLYYYQEIELLSFGDVTARISKIWGEIVRSKTIQFWDQHK